MCFVNATGSHILSNTKGTKYYCKTKGTNTIGTNTLEWDGWAHKPGLTHLSRGPQSRALCGAVCALSIAIVLY